MVTISMPLWLAIVIAVVFSITTLYLVFGDLIARIVYKHIKEKEKEDNDK